MSEHCIPGTIRVTCLDRSRKGMAVGRDLCKAGGNSPHEQGAILAVSFQQGPRTGRACFTPKVSVAVANAQHLSKTTHPHVMSWLLKWKASPYAARLQRWAGRLLPSAVFARGVPSPAKLQLIQSRALWGGAPGTSISSLRYLNQIPVPRIPAGELSL